MGHESRSAKRERSAGGPSRSTGGPSRSGGGPSCGRVSGLSVDLLVPASRRRRPARRVSVGPGGSPSARGGSPSARGGSPSARGGVGGVMGVGGAVQVTQETFVAEVIHGHPVPVTSLSRPFTSLSRPRSRPFRVPRHFPITSPSRPCQVPAISRHVPQLARLRHVPSDESRHVLSRPRYANVTSLPASPITSCHVLVTSTSRPRYESRHFRRVPSRPVTSLSRQHHVPVMKTSRHFWQVRHVPVTSSLC